MHVFPLLLPVAESQSRPPKLCQIIVITLPCFDIERNDAPQAPLFGTAPDFARVQQFPVRAIRGRQILCCLQFGHVRLELSHVLKRVALQSFQCSFEMVGFRAPRLSGTSWAHGFSQLGPQDDALVVRQEQFARFRPDGCFMEGQRGA